MDENKTGSVVPSFMSTQVKEERSLSEKIPP